MHVSVMCMHFNFIFAHSIEYEISQQRNFLIYDIVQNVHLATTPGSQG